MINPYDIVPQEFYLQDTITVAKGLLGKYIVRKHPDGIAVCKIVETEAYLGLNDKACHSYKGNPNGRTNIMYDDGGYAYVYLIYGMYNCFNVTSCPKEVPEAVLIRAAQPVDGFDFISQRRDNKPEYQWLNGPGKLCIGLDITRELYGMPLFETDSPLNITYGESVSDTDIAATPRINIAYAEEDALKPYRFIIKNSRYLSQKWRGKS